MLELLFETDKTLSTSIFKAPRALHLLWVTYGYSFQEMFPIKDEKLKEAFIHWYLWNRRNISFYYNQQVMENIVSINHRLTLFENDEIFLCPTPLMQLIWNYRNDLQEQFPYDKDGCNIDFWKWWLENGSNEYGMAIPFLLVGNKEVIPFESIIEFLEKTEMLRNLSLEMLSEFRKYYHIFESGISISPYMHLIWKSRADLQSAFPDILETDVELYLQWWKDHGQIYENAAESDIDVVLVKSKELIVRNEAAIIGHPAGMLGIGEDARLISESLDSVSIGNTLFIANPEICSEDYAKNSFASLQEHSGDYFFNIFCMPASDILHVLIHHGLEIFYGAKFNICIIQWELENFPKDYDILKYLFDQVCSISTFSAQSISKSLGVKVDVIPLPVKDNLSVDLTLKQQNKLKFTYFFAFDGNSFISRKNPLGVIEAFQRAFVGKQDVKLIIKAMNTGKSDIWHECKRRAYCDERITIVEDKLTRNEYIKLLEQIDCVVSLHRSEGFGRVIAEAMLMNKPVIVSQYSGNMDYTDDETAFMVTGQLVPLYEGDYHFYEENVWFQPDLDAAAREFMYVFEHPEAAADKATVARAKVLKNYSLEACGKSFYSAILKLAIKESDLFDEDFYIRNHPEASADPIEHYIKEGWQQDCNPSALFNTAYYLEKNSDVKKLKMNPLVHYILHGQAEGRVQSELEEKNSFERQVQTQNTKALKKIIRESDLFDEDFYIRNHPEASADPIEHYIKEGWQQDCNPSALFNTAYYLEKNSDVKKLKMNPLVHYILHGQAEGKKQEKIIDIGIMSKIEDAQDGIIFISHDATTTGAPIVLLELCRQYRNTYKKSMVIILMAGGELQKDFEELAIVINLNMSLFTKNIAIDNAYKIFFDILAKKGYTQCVANTVLSGFLNEFLEDNCIETTYLIHEMPELIDEFNFTQAALNIGSSRSSIVFSSKYVADKFSNLYMNKNAAQHIIPQGISENAICTDKKAAKKRLCEIIGCDSDSCKVILGAGLAQYRKGTDLFLSTAAECYKKGKIDNLHFIWLGNREKEYEDWKYKVLPTLQYKEHIHFIDFVDDPTDFFGGSDIFLLTSREDPLPGVALIALKNLLPVIMFESTGGIEEYITKSNGAVIEQFNTLKMTEKVLEFLKYDKAEKCETKVNTTSEYFTKVMTLFKKKNNQKISVIIPNYNYEQYVEQRIDSIIKQAYHPDEIIFLDDCSTDNSVVIAENKLRESGVPYQIILNEENEGVYRQWLKGIQLARNELIWIAEADDFSDPNFLKSLVSYFNSDDNLGLAYAQSKIVDDSGNVVSEDVRFHTDSIDQEKWKKSYISKGIYEIEHALLYRNTIPNVSACLFNRKYLEGIDETLLRYKYCGDWYLYSYLLIKSNVAFCKRSLNYFRKHSSNVTTINTYRSDYIKEVLEIKKYLFSILNISCSQYNIMLELFAKDFLKGNPNEDNIRVEISEGIRYLESKTAKHIVFVTFNGEFGGSEVLWYEAAKHIVQKQCKVSVLCKSHLLDEEKKGELGDCNVDLFEQSVLNIESFQKLMPDYVVFSIGDHNDGGEFFTFCKKNNIEYVIVNQLVKEDMWTTDKEQLDQIFGGYASASATFFTCKNNIDIFERKMNSQLSNAQIHFNPISIDRDDYVPYPNIEDTYHLAFPARLLTIHKGQDVLIRVLAQSKWRKRNLQVNFYGEGPDYKKLVRLVNELNLASIKFHGYINNIRTIWENNHAFILTSHMEGIPIVLLGAMFAGRVSIVTDVGGNSEVLEKNRTGFIARTPTEEAIDEALEHAWTKREEWKRMGEHARESILSHYPEKPLEDFKIKLEKVFNW